MAELKTKKTTASVDDFLNKVSDENKRTDAFALLEIFKKITGETPKMWGTSIIGFGEYHYKSERSTQEGDWPLVGFSPRKQNLTLYLMISTMDVSALLANLGKHKTSVGCLYINKLSDVDLNILEEIIKTSFQQMKKQHNIN
jgi:hypothetical protein